MDRNREQKNFGAFRQARAVAVRGMSLVEVCLALGLVSFALVSVLGILPVGLITLRDARFDMMRANIVAKVGMEYASTAFAQMADSQDYYFDDQGQPVTPNSPDRLYRAHAQTFGPVFPGMRAEATNSLCRLQITVSRLSGPPGYAPVGPDKAFSVKIPDSGF